MKVPIKQNFMYLKTVDFKYLMILIECIFTNVLVMYCSYIKNISMNVSIKRKAN